MASSSCRLGSCLVFVALPTALFASRKKASAQSSPRDALRAKERSSSRVNEALPASSGTPRACCPLSPARTGVEPVMNANGSARPPRRPPRVVPNAWGAAHSLVEQSSADLSRARLLNPYRKVVRDIRYRKPFPGSLGACRALCGALRAE